MVAMKRCRDDCEDASVGYLITCIIISQPHKEETRMQDGCRLAHLMDGHQVEATISRTYMYGGRLWWWLWAVHVGSTYAPVLSIGNDSLMLLSTD